jgi:hypothetical protein
MGKGGRGEWGRGMRRGMGRECGGRGVHACRGSPSNLR